MSYRLFGALLVIAGCGGFGFSLVQDQRQKERYLRSLRFALQYMQWELCYRLTPLPELFRKAAGKSGGRVGEILSSAAREMDQQVLPDAESCLLKAAESFRDLSRKQRLLLKQLGRSLGQFDLQGQLDGLKAVGEACAAELQVLEEGKGQRFRSYETLGLCGGAALVILFL